MNKQDIIDQITPEVYVIESEDAWKSAPYTGCNDISLFYSSNTPYEINWRIWETPNGLDDAQKVQLTFEVYIDIPCYPLLSHIYIQHYNTLSNTATERFWSHVASLLAQPEEALAQPVVYLLAVDFFEDQTQQYDAWNRLVTPETPRNTLRRILEADAAMPFSEKAPLYRRLLPDPSWHQAIYNSIRSSYYSFFGGIDKIEAVELLKHLHSVEQMEGYHAFRQLLQQGGRYTNYYQDQKQGSE